MRLISYNGLMGTGKTLNSVDEAVKHFKQQNKRYQLLSILYLIIPYRIKLLRKLKEKFKNYYDYRNLFPQRKINSVYSNFPFLLDIKKNIYSNAVLLDDLNGTFSFLPDSFIVLDEIQLSYDSDEYKDKIVNLQLSKIGKFMQAHRHFGINSIILCSQMPNRIFIKGREICNVYAKHLGRIIIPFWLYFIIISLIFNWFFSFNEIYFFLILGGYYFSKNYSFLSIVEYYNYDEYGKSIPKNKKAREMLPFDYKKKLKIIKHSHLFKTYDSRYLAKYNYKKNLVNRGCWKSLKVEYAYLKNIFEVDKTRVILEMEQLQKVANKVREDIFNQQ